MLISDLKLRWLLAPHLWQGIALSRLRLDSSTGRSYPAPRHFRGLTLVAGYPVKTASSNVFRPRIFLRHVGTLPSCSLDTTLRARVFRQGWHASLHQIAEHMSKVRILVADDHAGVREIVEDMLEPTFEVIGMVGNGKALVETARRLQPDVIITDISMPILSGIEAAKQLKESGSRAKVVFLTVHSDPDIVRACLNMGACGYVVKPRMDSDLLPAVREALAGRIFLSPTDNYKN